jgi:hypothetical protein
MRLFVNRTGAAHVGVGVGVGFGVGVDVEEPFPGPGCGVPPPERTFQTSFPFCFEQTSVPPLKPIFAPAFAHEPPADAFDVEVLPPAGEALLFPFGRTRQLDFPPGPGVQTSEVPGPPPTTIPAPMHAVPGAGVFPAAATATTDNAAIAHSGNR